MKRSFTLLAISFQLAIPVSFAQDFWQAEEEKNITHIRDTDWEPDAKIQFHYRAKSSWQNFLKNHGSWWVMFNEKNGMPHRAMGKPIQMDPSKDAEQNARSFIQNELQAFNIPGGELHLTSSRRNKKYQFVDFVQRHQGLEVLFSRATVRLTFDQRVILFGMDVFPEIEANTKAGISISEAQQFAVNSLSGTVIQATPHPHLAILPVDDATEAGGYDFRLVYSFDIQTLNSGNIPGDYYMLVDAHTGKIWYRYNKSHNCSPASGSVEVKADITDNPLQASSVKPLPHMKVVVNGTTYYTDASGQINLPSLTGPTEATFSLEGRYCRVVNDQTGITPGFTDTLYPGVNVISFDSASIASERSAYYQVNVVHDHMKKYTSAGFTSMDIPMITNVEINTGTCNAYYSGNSINFYAAGGGCPSIALINDVIFHEYGHGINYDLYSYFSTQFNNGALGEGYADVWAFTITQDPILGQGFQGGANTYVRRYDIDPKRYPEDLVGEVHADGEIIAGAWWDLFLNFNNNIDTLMNLFIGSQAAAAMAPDGSEGLLYRDILVDVLLEDDNDADITNSTPNALAIVSAFAKHGITLLTNAGIFHNEVQTANDNTPIVLTSDVIIDFPAYVGSLDLMYRTSVDSAFKAIALTPVTTFEYTATIPQQPKGTIVEYYFILTDIFNNTAVVEPYLANAAQPNLPFYLMVGFDVLVKEDYDNNFGNWVIDPDNTDDATTGNWVIVSPVPSTSGSVQVQTGQDHTSEGVDLNICAVTGNAASPISPVGDSDVDKGQTTLQSPVFDLSGYTKPAISYWRWYINNPPTGANPGNDTWKVFISNNGSTWVKVERTPVSDNTWRKKAFLVSDYVTPNSTVSLRFVASDSLIPGTYLDGGSIVEAAVDDLFVWDEALNNTGIDHSDDRQWMMVYPNPADGLVHVAFRTKSSGPGKLSLINMVGQQLLTRSVDQAGATLSLDIRQYPAGTYLLQFSTNEGIYYKELIIQ